jgi:hypothetical protein
MAHHQVLSDEQIEAIRTEVFKRWQAMVDRGQIPGDDSCDHDLARAIESATLEAVPLPPAMAIVTKALQEDADYAWAWHCNLAMAAIDEGMEHYAANQAAARFMYSLANVDTTKHPGFPSPTHPPAQQEPFGYFKATPFGWIDCAETDEGAVALYERPQKSA